MKINERQLKDIIDLVHDWSDFDVDSNGFREYDIMPYVNKSALPELLKEVNKVVKRKWKFWR